MLEFMLEILFKVQIEKFIVYTLAEFIIIMLNVLNKFYKLINCLYFDTSLLDMSLFGM